MSWWHLSRQHLSWWHLSILAISQLLLIHFLPNCLEQIFLGPNLFGTTSCFWSLTFLDPTFFNSNLFLDPNSFNIKFVEPKFVLGPKSLVQSRFCHLYFEPNFFFLAEVFQTPNVFWTSSTTILDSFRQLSTLNMTILFNFNNNNSANKKTTSIKSETFWRVLDLVGGKYLA